MLKLRQREIKVREKYQECKEYSFQQNEMGSPGFLFFGFPAPYQRPSLGCKQRTPERFQHASLSITLMRYGNPLLIPGCENKHQHSSTCLEEKVGD